MRTMAEPTNQEEWAERWRAVDARLSAAFDGGERISTGGGCEAWSIKWGEFDVLVTDVGGADLDTFGPYGVGIYVDGMPLSDKFYGEDDIAADAMAARRLARSYVDDAVRNGYVGS